MYMLKSYTVNQMCGAGAEKEQTHLTGVFDNHEIMVLETHLVR